ncbi:MAG: type II secretion system F family protein [Planctomycetia bacterium]|nr:type II secretion system F family protein [Planctomycetia bacterium]
MPSLIASVFSPRIGLRDLAGLCRRLGTALSSGIDVRRVWQREAADARSPILRRHLQAISDAVARGETVSDAMRPVGEYFPALVHAMVDVGEHTGHTAEIFRHLAEHYEEQLRLRRSFMASITGPMIQLGMALAIIGLLILVMGALSSAGRGNIDILGLGLVGESGFVVYCLTLVTIAAGGVFLYQAMRRGLAWTEPVQKFLLRLPAVGSPIKTISLAQMAWAMQLTMDSGMELLRAMKLSIASTRNAFYTQHTDRIVSSLRSGNEIHEALEATGAFPHEFLSTIEVGERSGRLPEAMKNLSAMYHDQAQLALRTLTTLAGYSVWAAVALMIVLAIVRMMMQTFVPYINLINDLSKP